MMASAGPSFGNEAVAITASGSGRMRRRGDFGDEDLEMGIMR